MSMTHNISIPILNVNRNTYLHLHQNAYNSNYITYMSVGDRVRQARKEAGLSQKILAAKIGVKQPTLSQLEKGGSKSTGFLGSIANVLGVNSYWLETGIPPKDRFFELTPRELFVLTTYRTASRKGIAMIDAAVDFASDPEAGLEGEEKS